MKYQILKEIWQKQPKGYYFISVKEDGLWTDHPFKNIEKALRFITKSNPKENDIYWCPATFKEPRRLKDLINPSKFLWSDLDSANPINMEEPVRPTHAWRSSSKRYQGLWELDKVHDPKEVEYLNKAIAYHLKDSGADTSGWDLGQVLRIPGTYNHKYAPKKRVAMLWAENKSYAPPIIIEATGEPPKETEITDLQLKVNPTKSFAQALMDNKRLIPRPTLSQLKTKIVEQGKRSEVLYKICHDLIEAGVSIDDTYVLLQGCVWNKFKGQKREHRMLMAEINKAVSHEMDEDRSSEGGDKKPSKKAAKKKLKNRLINPFDYNVTSFEDLMGKPGHKPGWLIPGFWTRRSHGIIAGQPKSFKTTLLLDFAISIATNTPFLGKYMPDETGPVLIIQSENAEWIMKDRISKIIAGRDLEGWANVKGTQLQVKFFEDIPVYTMNNKMVDLLDPDCQEKIEEIIAQIKPIIVIFDPLYLMFTGNTNNADELQPLFQWLLKVKTDNDCGTILVHHFGKDSANTAGRRSGSRMLGSNLLYGWIESAWYISVNKPTGDSEEEEDEPEDDEDEQKPFTGQVNITLEREFRGAGMFPKVAVSLKMDDEKYEAEVSRHKKRGKGRPASSTEDLLTQIVQELTIHKNGLNFRRLTASTGSTRYKVEQTIAKNSNLFEIIKDTAKNLTTVKLKK